jgi:hypothetical protein
MKLSEHVSLAEVTKSATAIKHDISNEPTIEHLENLKALAENVFEPLRKHFNVPIGITSGYRSEELNKRIGGSSTSQHCNGQAIDIDADVYGGVTNAKIFGYLSEHVVFDQLIWEFGTNTEPAWVHVSYKKEGKNRGQKLVAYKKNGRTLYKEL